MRASVYFLGIWTATQRYYEDKGRLVKKKFIDQRIIS